MCLNPLSPIKRPWVPDWGKILLNDFSKQSQRSSIKRSTTKTMSLFLNIRVIAAPYWRHCPASLASTSTTAKRQVCVDANAVHLFEEDWIVSAYKLPSAQDRCGLNVRIRLQVFGCHCRSNVPVSRAQWKPYTVPRLDGSCIVVLGVWC